MGLLKSLFGGAPDESRVEDRIYDAILRQALQPVFFGDNRLPDTFAGRFESATFHAALVLQRIQKAGELGPELAQTCVDRLFSGFDDALREIGTGDLSVQKKIRKVAEAYQGRAGAYRDALSANEPATALKDAIGRNMSLSEETSGRLANYGLVLVQALETASDEDLLKGVLELPVADIA